MARNQITGVYDVKLIDFIPINSKYAMPFDLRNVESLASATPPGSTYSNPTDIKNLTTLETARAPEDGFSNPTDIKNMASIETARAPDDGYANVFDIQVFIGINETITFTDTADAEVTKDVSATDTITFTDLAQNEAPIPGDNTLGLTDLAEVEKLTFVVSINDSLILDVRDTDTSQFRKSQENEAFTQWGSFLPRGAWTANTTYDGVFRVIGDTLEAKLTIDLSGTPNTETFNIDIPPNLMIDTSKISAASSAVVGEATLTINATDYPGLILWRSALVDSLEVNWLEDDMVGVLYQVVNESSPDVWGSGDKMDITYRVPVIV